MKRSGCFLRQVILGCVWVGAVGCSWAQQAPVGSQAIQTAPAVVQSEASEYIADPSTLLLAGQRVIQLIDMGLASELWQHVSVVVQSSMDSSDFTRGIYVARSPLGVVVNRRWVAITRIEPQEGDWMPSGVYVMVSFLSSFEARAGMQEQVLFRLDGDNVWRVAGYVLR